MTTHCCDPYFYWRVCCLQQGEEGPPSLEYIKAKDLFPQKELVKEDEGLQVSCAAGPSVRAECLQHLLSWVAKMLPVDVDAAARQEGPGAGSSESQRRTR